MARILFIIIVSISAFLLILFAVQTLPPRQGEIPNTAGASLQEQSSQEAGAAGAETSGETAVVPTQPRIWIGLAASLFGALVFWISVTWMAKHRGY